MKTPKRTARARPKRALANVAAGRADRPGGALGAPVAGAEPPIRATAPEGEVTSSEHIAPTTIAWVKRSRFNPIRALTPEYLSRIMDTFATGYLREFAQMADAIKHRDDMISVCLGKREKAVARHGFEILIDDGLDDAQKARAAEHQAALKFFYSQCSCSHVLEQDLTGGFRLLVRQMMEAVGARYAVHEIVWQPVIDPASGAPRLTARFNYVPLWFFEATTGRLRFIPQYFGAVFGQDMAPEEWLVTVGDGILEPLSVLYMFKTMSLKDWVSFSEKFGMPGILGKTPAAKDSPGWQAMEAAVAAFGQDWSAVCNTEGSIDLIEAKGGAGSLPFPPLVERCDRGIASLCRGADLSTMSSHGSSGGRGASVQGEESDILEQDDAEHISETLEKVSRQVIRQLFGQGEAPLARIKVVVPEKKDTADIVNRLTYLVGAGVPVGQDYARNELDVPAPIEGAALLVKPAVPAMPIPPENAAELANAAHRAALANAGQAAIKSAQAAADALAAKQALFRPLALRLAAMAALSDPAQIEGALRQLHADLPKLGTAALKASPELADTFAQVIGQALAEGAAAAAKKTAAAKSAA